MSETRRMKVWRGDEDGGEFVDFDVEVEEGMVVLDVIHRIQARHATDLAVRWNCKAGKCGSCGMEINGMPSLACMDRMSDYPDDEPITVQPLKSFPVIKDLVSDVSWNYEQNQKIAPFTPEDPDEEDYEMSDADVERVQHFRECIECFLCQDVCHVIRDQDKREEFVGPRYMIRLASLEMHPLDVEDRIADLKNEYGSGMCNITKCCTEICPKDIEITDDAIIPLKERVVDEHYDPLARLMSWIKDAAVAK